jgi:hypothetical protein
MGRHSHAATVEAPPSRPARRAHRQLVRSATQHGAHIRLSLPDGRLLQLDAAPDPSAADRVRSRFRRLHRAELVIDDGEILASVHGTGHRREGALPVAVEVVLALALEGCPTIVSLGGPAG